MTSTRPTQLVCPAGSLRALRAAVDAGADAIYLGLNDATHPRDSNSEAQRFLVLSGIRTPWAAMQSLLGRALVMAGDTEFGLVLKNTLDAIGPLVPRPPWPAR